MDEQQRVRVLDDLQGLIKGELRFDSVSRTLYSTDASIYQLRPAGVVIPQDEEDVQQLVRYAAEHAIALIPRGAGSGLAGEALGRGIVVDLSKHFNAIKGVAGDFVRVQPGVTCRALNAYLKPLGRRFAPDPVSADQCTIGGMLATNASGPRVLRHGYTRHHVQRIRMVLDTGDVAELGSEIISEEAKDRSDHLQDIITAVAVLLEQNQHLIQREQPHRLYNRCGYVLNDVLEDGRLHLARLLTGSEGTLGIFTEATLKTIPLPGGTTVVLLGYSSLESALNAVRIILPTLPSECELVDRRLLKLASGNENGDAISLIPQTLEAVLFVEYEAESMEEATWAARRLPHLLSRQQAAPIYTLSALEQGEGARVWRLWESILPSLYRLRSGVAPVPVIEDIAVMPDELPEYLRRLQDILQEHEMTASFLVHAGSGRVDARPLLDMRDASAVSRLKAMTEKVYELALQMGGTLSSQHGTGVLRTPWVSRQYRELYPVFHQLKSIFDPKDIFNPGKIVNPQPELSGWPLRDQPQQDQSSAPLLSWSNGTMIDECLQCNGCGQCRIESESHRMCPIFHVTHEEAATPRAKANLLRDVFARVEDNLPLSADEVRNVADLCINCKMCAIECPARVNIPKLMLEAKAINVVEHGLDRKDWFFARADRWARWGCTFSWLVNTAMSSGMVRWWLDKLFGLSRVRRLPRFAPKSFMHQAHRRGLTQPPSEDRPTVVYFIDVFANYNDPTIGEAVVAVLEHNGIDVHVPRGQRSSGASPLAHGDAESAREVAQRNIRVLAELARQGLPIICSEPTAALMLQQDYLDILPDDDDARLVASKTTELMTYLWQLHSQGKLKKTFQPVPLSIGHHVPCHVKALGGPPAGPRLLGLIPELNVRTIDVGCSGMAGTFGMQSESYETSLQAGKAVLDEVRQPMVSFASTECSACRMQIEGTTGKRALHPVQYLAMAYGLLPDLGKRLHEPMKALVL